MRLIRYIILSLMLTTAANTVAEVDLLYPSGHSLTTSYEVSHNIIPVSDTLTVSRYLVNGESYALTSVYFGDNLPSSFLVISYSLTLNGESIGCGFSGLNSDSVLTGYHAYQWVVDWPDSFGGLQEEILPGDSLHLEIMVTCGQVGSYSLPLHTTVCYGNGEGIFAVPSASVAITVETAVGIDRDDSDVLPDGYLVTRAYPNPFNASVTVKATGLDPVDSQARLTIFNSLGQVVYSDIKAVVRGQVSFDWKPPEAVGSGLYLYRLATASVRTDGKVMLIK